MAERTLKLVARLIGKDELSREAKKGEKALKDLKQAAKESAEAIAKFSGISLAVVAGGLALAAKNSEELGKQFAVVTQSAEKMAGKFGDMLAKSSAWRGLVTGIADGFDAFSESMQRSGGAIDTVIQTSVAAAIPVLKVFAMTLTGLVEAVAVARRIAPAAQEEGSNLIEGSMQWIHYQTARAVEGMGLLKKSSGMSADAKERMDMAFGDTGAKISRAMDQASVDVAKLQAFLDELNLSMDAVQRNADKGLDKGLRDRMLGTVKGKKEGEDPSTSLGKDIAARVAAMEAAEKKAAEDYGQAIADMIADQDRDAEAALEKTLKAKLDAKMAYDEQSRRLEEEERERVHDLIAEQMATQKEFGDFVWSITGSLAEGIGASIAAVVKGEASFGDAMQQMAEDVAFGVGTQAAIKAAYETAEAFGALAGVLTAPLAAGHFAAAAKYAAVAALGFGAGAIAGAIGGGGGGGRASAATATTEGEYTPRASSSGGMRQENVTIVQQIHGSLIQERDTARALQDSTRSWRRTQGTGRAMAGA